MAENIAPTVIQSEGSTKKTIAFPFQRGSYGVPASASPAGVTFSQITALLNTAKGERVMNYDYGVDLHQYTFKNMTPIEKMRISAAVKSAIENYVPGVKVDRVIAGENKYQSGIGMYTVLDIFWSENGRSASGQFLYAVPGNGVE